MQSYDVNPIGFEPAVFTTRNSVKENVSSTKLDLISQQTENLALESSEKSQSESKVSLIFWYIGFLVFFVVVLLLLLFYVCSNLSLLQVINRNKIWGKHVL